MEVWLGFDPEDPGGLSGEVTFDEDLKNEKSLLCEEWTGEFSRGRKQQVKDFQGSE